MLDSQTCSWQPALTPSQSVAAVDIVREIAGRLRERELIETAVELVVQQTDFPEVIHWQPHGVAQGYAGLAIMYSYLDACFPNEDWDVAGHHYLELAVQAAEQLSYLPLGMFSGLSGLAFATWSLSKNGKRYPKLLAALEEALLPQVVLLADWLSIQKKDISVEYFDLISGLSGVGAYLLFRKEDPQAVAALRAVLNSLVALTREEAGLPRWYTPVHLLQDQKTTPYYPHGNLNCGLAHGIPGPLGLLSLAHRAGMRVEGLEEAISRVANWLLQHRLDDQWGVNWPSAVRIEDDGTLPSSLSKETTSPFEPSRTAWCYGSPGLVRALWFAGEALDRAEYRQMALAAMEAVYRRPLEVRRIDSPTFCHGVAGLVQITLRFAHDTRLPQFREAAQTLGEQLLSLYDSERLLGYYNLEPGGNRVDQPGLLIGASGVVLVLLAASTNIEPTWDRLFLLS